MGSAATSLDFTTSFEQAPGVLPRPPLVGRSTELDHLKEILLRSAQGAGQVVFLAGEAGIGKSRLCEEVAVAASRRDCAVVWGRCWEAGGGPAFWPWRQALMGLSRALNEPELWARNQLLSAFMGGGRGLSMSEGEFAGLAPDHARFLLLEAVTTTLCEAAKHQPLVIILEDMHAADSASLYLLDFIESQIRLDRMLIVASYRPNQIEGTELPRIAQRAEVLSLTPLGRPAVEEYLHGRIRGPLPAETITEVVLATEGNPLFLEQISQVIASDPSAPRAALLTQGIQSIIAERLAINSPGDLELLRLVTVLGREFNLEEATALAERPESTVETALERLVAQNAIERVGLQDYRFAHILIQETLYHALPAVERGQLHRARAERLRQACERGDRNVWSEVAHHYLACEAFEEGILALEAAARSALHQLAFDDAIQFVEQALSHLPESAPPERRAELLLLLAQARLPAGHITSGRAACYEAARVAQVQNSPELLARAALQCGSVFLYAKVDRRLVGLLQDALSALPAHAGSERAEVSARLAAALQPSPTPDVPFDLARSAIGLARRQNEPQLLLRVLRWAISALMDMGPAEERLLLNREHRALARALNATSDLWRANCRLLFDYFELGRFDEAYDTLSDVVAQAEGLDHPAYLWRATAMRAMAATFRGRLTEAERLLHEIQPVAERARDPNWQRARCMLWLAWYRASGKRAPEDLLEAVAAAFEGEIFAHFCILGEWARAGQNAQVRGGLEPGDFEKGFASADVTLLQELAYIAISLGDREQMRLVYEQLLPHADRFVSGGMTSLTWEPPLHHCIGLLAHAAGMRSAALEHLQTALRGVEQGGSRCWTAWIQIDLAHALTDDQANDEQRLEASSHLEQAVANATACGIARALDAAQRLRAQLEGHEPAPASTRALRLPQRSITLAPDGEVWCLRQGNETFRLANTKGVQLLARLMDEPSREFHVLDLVRGGNGGAPDGGDAGGLLDDNAKLQYQQRIAELRENLDEATQWNDHARRSALELELESLTRELSRAFGLGGRVRKGSSAAERARVNVQRRLKDALKRVRAVAPGLAKELERSVRTGTYCVYDP